MESVYCVNCSSAGGSMVLENEQVLHCIRKWSAPRSVEAHDLICTACWTKAQETLHLSPMSNVGRKCVLCNKTLESRTRLHQLISLKTNTQHHVNIRNIIVERLAPLEVRASHYICHPCWQRADRAAVHYSVPSSSRATSTTTSNQMRCANCGINLIRQRRHVLNDETILGQIQQQVAPQVVTESDYICGACHTLFLNNSSTTSSNTQDSQHTLNVGHQHVCLGCGCSLAQARSHSVGAEYNQHILDVVQNWIQPREIRSSDSLCHRCFQRAEAVTINASLPESVNLPPQHVETITLPNYSRASDTHRRCIFQQCHNTSQKVVPLVLRVRLFRDHNYYIPPDCRICSMHLARQSWADLFDIENVNHRFTAAHIEDFCELLKSDNILDFENIESMDDNLVWYWLGRTKEQFREIEAELPNYPKRATSLAAYLMKLRTGDSDDRISTLLNISRSTLRKLTSKAREIMVEHYVPANLGLQHITREEVASKNLYIPESLFGNPGSNMEERKAIVIMDGTYIYVQKSSNYAYQKKTYSLHKYRNLVKPFIIVCCDGYIIDVLGPYAATKSDSDIIKNEFSDSSNPMRQYFRDGDVMILDRGFRDSISLLESLNYSVHYPLSLEPGEHQLSTENANESRKVTLCRWVVEVVNGRFKRDFKLFRQDFFNRASKHLMQDFRVAAALINKFHPVLEDRGDAREIISIIQEKMFTNNSLADFVEHNNLNRRRAQFESITVNSDNIREFPQMEYNDMILIPLGVYQIKQARSYYGEHVRQDGSYIIEVCREVDRDLINEMQLINSENVWLLRGKIQSRHISHKTYFVYILVDSTQIGRQAIVQYCCNCIVGRRTIGCCAHIMTIIWYLSYGRYQNINPPSQFLNNILLDNIEDEQ